MKRSEQELDCTKNFRVDLLLRAFLYGMTSSTNAQCQIDKSRVSVNECYNFGGMRDLVESVFSANVIGGEPKNLRHICKKKNQRFLAFPHNLVVYMSCVDL